jgi:hypothetical protein
MAPVATEAAAENSKSLKVLDEMLKKLTISKVSSVPVRSAYDY